MFPSPVGFGFYEDAIRFIGLLAILAALGDIYSFYIFYVNQENWWKVRASKLISNIYLFTL